MNYDDYSNYDLYDEECTGQPPDADQSLIVPRRGLEPDSGPDDEPMIVERRGSPADTDSLVFEEDMDECPDEYIDDCDNLDAVILPYLTGSKPGKKKRKKKHKKKSKKKASASSKGVNLLELAAFVGGGDEDAQFTDGEQESPAKGRFRQPSVCQMEDELLEKAGFIYRKTVLYYYNGQYYAPNSGKSILGNFIQKLYPENSVSNLSLGELGGKFETESLLYSRINISLDLPQEVLNASAVSKLKRITGGDSIEIQRKNQGALKLDHNMKFLFATNFPLRIESNDPAFLDRIIFLPFMNSVPKEERDPNLAKKLWKERDAVVTKALQYARDLMDQGWQFPPIPDVDCMRGVQRKNSMDYLKEFLENHCEMGDYNYFTATSDLRRAYEAYCDENGTCPCSATAFNKYMEQAGGVRDRKRLTASENPVWGFYGIRLRP